MTNKPATSARVPGHTLVAEGAAFDERKQRKDFGHRFYTTDGPGRALCSCGDLSDELPSRRYRREWHREHKAAVLSASTA